MIKWILDLFRERKPDGALVEWKYCRGHRFYYIYANACPHCLWERR